MDQYFVDSAKDFFLELGDFLDEFYVSSHEKRMCMLHAVPKSAKMDITAKAFLAATLHKLSNDYGLDAPDWIWNTDCYLKDPFFGGGAKGNLRLLFMYISPPEFKHRNLFVDENVLVRV